MKSSSNKQKGNGKGKGKGKVVEQDPEPEVSERKRLKTLAFSNKVISEVPARPRASLSPSSTVLKHHGKDIVKKSQRKKQHFLFSFPGLFSPIAAAAAGKIGDLKDLNTNNPILYLNFPNGGRMKLFGTIVYPKNKYLTLQFPRGGKSVMCDDYFDNMIVFSDAWWIGTEDENPDEAQLDFPRELSEGQHADYDFKGGAGSTSVNKQSDCKNEITSVDEHSPDVKLDDTLSDDGNKDLLKGTPVRQSARNAGKRINFGEASSGDDSVEISDDFSEGEDNKIGGLDSSRSHTSVKTENLSVGNFDINNEDAADSAQYPEQIQESSVSKTKSKEQSCSAIPVTKSSNHDSLVQATISTLFKKVEKKKVGSSNPSHVQLPSSQAHKTPRNPRNPASPKVSNKKTTPSKRKINQDVGRPRKKSKNLKENDEGGKSMTKQKKEEVLDDDIEDLSSSSQATDFSDEDWAA